MAGFITSAPDSFKDELARGIHDFTINTGDIFKCALGIASPVGTFDADTTNYSDLGSDELPNGSGYTTGGFAWTAAQNITPVIAGGKAYWSWSVNPTWLGASFSTSGCLIYNASKGNRAVYVGSFGGVQTVLVQNLILTLPVYAPGTSILRIR